MSRTEIEVIKERDKNRLKEAYANKGMAELIKLILPYIVKDKYVKIKPNGEVVKTEVNYSLMLLGALNKISKSNLETEIVNKATDYILEKVSKSIYQNNVFKRIKVPSRKSKEEIGKIKDVFFKTVLKGEAEFALEYAQEFYLRESEEFLKNYRFSALINGDEKDFETLIKAAFISESAELIELFGKENSAYLYPLTAGVYFESIYPWSLEAYKTIFEKDKKRKQLQIEKKKTEDFEESLKKISNDEELIEIIIEEDLIKSVESLKASAISVLKNYNYNIVNEFYIFMYVDALERYVKKYQDENARVLVLCAYHYIYRYIMEVKKFCTDEKNDAKKLEISIEEVILKCIEIDTEKGLIVAANILEISDETLRNDFSLILDSKLDLLEELK